MKPAMAESTDLPAHDPSGAGIDHKGGADEPGPSMDVDKVDHPQRAGRSTRYRRLTLSSGHGALLIVVIVFFRILCRPAPSRAQPFQSALGHLDAFAATDARHRG